MFFMGKSMVSCQPIDIMQLSIHEDPATPAITAQVAEPGSPMASAMIRSAMHAAYVICKVVTCVRYDMIHMI